VSAASWDQVVVVAQVPGAVVVQAGGAVDASRQAISTGVVDRAAFIGRCWVDVVAIGQEDATESARWCSWHCFDRRADSDSSTAAFRNHERVFAIVEFGIVHETHWTTTGEGGAADAGIKIALAVISRVVAVETLGTVEGWGRSRRSVRRWNAGCRAWPGASGARWHFPEYVAAVQLDVEVGSVGAFTFQGGS